VIARTSAPFWQMFRALPAEVKRQSRRTFRRFIRDPFHASLRFKRLRGHADCWSVRISASYRAVCRRKGQTVYWFWIGSHANFDREFA